MIFLSINTDHIVSWLMGMPSDTDLRLLVDVGIPCDSLKTLAANGIDVMGLIGMSNASVTGRFGGYTLTQEVGAKVYKALTFVVMAEALLGDREYAMLWVSRPLRGLDGLAAIDMLGTEEDFKTAVSFIERIAHGI